MHKDSKYVLFLDDDIKLHPGSIGTLAREMEKNPEVYLKKICFLWWWLFLGVQLKYLLFHFLEIFWLNSSVLMLNRYLFKLDILLIYHQEVQGVIASMNTIWYTTTCKFIHVSNLCKEFLYIRLCFLLFYICFRPIGS